MTGRHPDAAVEAVLNVLAPVSDPGISGSDPVRVPMIRVAYEGQYVMPSDEWLTALAERIVAAVRTASRP